MAISFARLTVHTRSKGHSAIAAAAYRAGTRLFDERTGETHDFSNRKDVVHAEIVLPDTANAKFLNREYLWNSVEESENRKDSQLAKEVTLALPKELEIKSQVALTKKFIIENFVSHGLGADFAIHDKLDGNPHAHILVTTRRVNAHNLSDKKARDLNPVFYGTSNKKVYDLWNHKWRDCQNEFFLENSIDLSVDAEYLIASKHQGKVRNPTDTQYNKEENGFRQQASFDTVKNTPEVVIEYLSERYATFTAKDIASFVFKNTETREDFDAVLAKVKANKNLVYLGPNDTGKELYTTRASYRMEEKLISQSMSMSGRMSKALSSRFIGKVASRHGLQAEQREAVKYLAQQGDVACLVGRAGTGKTYTMKAVQDMYTTKGYNIYGAALSGIAAKELESKTGIKSDTIHSLSYRINQNRFQPRPGSIIVIDEAGMVSLKDMARIISFAKKSHCKVILLGDPEQLQPIMAGAPFRAILNQVGFVEMKNIQRQDNAMDREASVNLAAGKIGLAVDHYANNGQFELYDDDVVQQKLVDAWSESIAKHGNKLSAVQNQVILAHMKVQVNELNNLARSSLIKKGILKPDKSEPISTAYGEIDLCVGDRIVFLKNNKGLGVYNGDFASIEAISGTNITAKVGDKTVEFNLDTYNDFKHGYAVTVHKSQGATFDRVFTYLDGFGWDKYITYVAMTRHKEELRVFANKGQYSNLESAKRQLSRATIRDNAIDYPLSYAERRGFDMDSTLARTVNYLAGTYNKIKDKWLYVTNYESWVKNKSRILRHQANKQIRLEAKQVAKFADLNFEVKRSWAKIYHARDKKNIDINDNPNYKKIIGSSHKRDAKAYELINNISALNKALDKHKLSFNDIETHAKLHQRRFDLEPASLQQNLPANNLSHEVREILMHPEWKNLEKAGGALLSGSVDILSKFKKMVLANDPKNTEREEMLINATTSLLSRVSSSKTEGAELKKLAPKIYQRALKISLTHDLTLNRSKGFER